VGAGTSARPASPPWPAVSRTRGAAGTSPRSSSSGSSFRSSRPLAGSGRRRGRPRPAELVGEPRLRPDPVDRMRDRARERIQTLDRGGTAGARVCSLASVPPPRTRSQTSRAIAASKTMAAAENHGVTRRRTDLLPTSRFHGLLPGPPDPSLPGRHTRTGASAISAAARGAAAASEPRLPRLESRPASATPVPAFRVCGRDPRRARRSAPSRAPAAHA
jgi:hypothetical protein